MSTFLSYVLYLVRHGTWTAIFFHMSSIQFAMGHRQAYLLYMTSYHYKQYIIKLYALKAGVDLNLGIEKETLFWSQTRWNCCGTGCDRRVFVGSKSESK